LANDIKVNATDQLIKNYKVYIFGGGLSDRHTATMETGVLQLQVRNCETAFQLICVRQADINFQQFKWLLKTFS